MRALRRTASSALLLVVCVLGFGAYDDVRLQAAVQGLLAFCGH